VGEEHHLVVAKIVKANTVNLI